MTDLPHKYDAKSIETKWEKFWEENEIYKSEVNPEKEKYCVVIPPPNVTGILHIGHILNNTIQDLYCRWKRMKGFEVCWVPGMDHAGISTQIMVEKDIAKKGKSKYDLGRKAFVDLVWEWKEKHGGHILKQLRKLGASVDWSKERFTLDDGLSQAVKEVFVDLYKKGYIYRGKRIINWDTKTQTALSDDEIFYKEQKDKLYYIKYHLKNSNEFITIATTRPETMLGDTAIAVNSKDKRYKQYINKTVILPLVNKEIPIIVDDYVDVEFGTGALKITPAHDLNDFEVGERHKLDIVNVITKDGKMNENGLEFEGLDIYTARNKIITKLEELKLIDKIEDYSHNVAFGDKSESIIEPYLSDQWFVSMKKLAEPAKKVVKEGKIKFHPERWTKTYFHWMNNIRDWCISRQLWWGHQIPIWYHNDNGEIYCDVNPPQDIENWTQDQDVLDTWFSSWLWPFSVFGWENSEKDKLNKNLNYYYPTDFLVTAADIIFLWVARMIMAGMEYMEDIPFKDVYFNALVRDGKGKKMSKTLGNSPDPLDVMDKYGTDALRFTIVYLAPLGNDVLYDEEKTEIGRNFITKLWNAGRFLMMNKKKVYSSDEYGNKEVEYDLVEKWINSRYNSTIRDIENNLNDYKLDDYTKYIYNFVWSDFCDWYIELLKIKINEDKDSARSIIDKALNHYEDIVKILHPVIPFVTEELWHILDDSRKDDSISLSEFPEVNKSQINLDTEENFEKLKEVVTGIRNLKAENDIAFSQKCKVDIKCIDKHSEKIISKYNNYMISLCNLKELNYGVQLITISENKVSKILNDYELHLSLIDAADINKLKEKYNKEIEKLEKYIYSLNRKLSNTDFIEKAATEIVEQEKIKYTEAFEKLKKLKNLIQ
ncbi:MAG: valine--tRNA ligase [Ignavibacteria bacterium]|nr:valine--tRNA ligase [Ignavibacteria bacterium]